MEAMKLNKNNFQKEVLESSIPVLVDFFADWCGPCRMIAPVLEELATLYEGRCKIMKVNVDENPDLAANYQISSIPALFFFKKGKMVDQVLGALPKKSLEEKINQLL
ncbi:MAG: thioredoxin [Candidatus Omnitrophota bacterium]|jgi:thioredoxin 1